MYASIEEFFNCLHDACASGLPRSLVNRFIVTEQTASTFRYFGRNCGVCGKFYPFPSSQREAAIKGIKELYAILDIKCATLRWDESNDGLTIKGTKRMEKEIERCGWSRIRYVIRRKRRGGEAKQSVERSGIAIFRDGAWREERDKVGGERGRRKKSGEHMECKCTYRGENGNSFEHVAQILLCRCISRPSSLPNNKGIML